MEILAVAGVLAWLIQPITEPKPLEMVEPEYPEAALTSQIEGPASFRATVADDGTVTSVSVLSVPPRQPRFRSGR